MMPKVRTTVVPVLALVLSLVAVAQASATTATVSPTGGKTATALTGTRFNITSGSSSTTITCTSTLLTGTFGSGSGSLPIAVSTDARLNLSGCRLPGGVEWAFSCSSTAWVLVTGLTVGAITPVTIGNISCTVSLTSNPACRTTIEGPGTTRGSLAASYSSTTDQLTIYAAGQSLVSKNSTCISTLLNGSASLTSSTGGDIPFGVTPVTTITVA